MMNQPREGIILLNKPVGWTSFDMVNKVRSILNQNIRKSSSRFGAKVGHGGTLDPFAEGLLVIAYGRCTKKLSSIIGSNKIYVATAQLGASSTTGDTEGEISVCSKLDDKPTEEQVKSALLYFKGESLQIPPSHSAIKIDGVRAYKLARKGAHPRIQPRKIFVNQIELVDYKYPQLVFSCEVSSGTYIRVLTEDIAKHLKTNAYLKRLTRTEVGKFKLANALSIEELTYEKILQTSLSCN